MSGKARFGVVLALSGLALLVAANRLAGQTRSTQPAVSPRTQMPQPAQGPAVPSQPDPQLTTPEGQRPTIFEALWNVIESTDEGRAIDDEQRKLLHDDLAKTNQRWRQMKVEMKESVRRANQPYLRHPKKYPPGVPPVHPN